MAGLGVVALIAWWSLRPRLGASLAWAGLFIMLSLLAGVLVPLLPAATAELDLLAFLLLPLLAELTAMAWYYTRPVAAVETPAWAVAAAPPQRKLFGRWSLPARASSGARQGDAAPRGASGGAAGALVFLVICVAAGMALAVVVAGGPSRLAQLLPGRAAAQPQAALPAPTATPTPAPTIVPSPTPASRLIYVSGTGGDGVIVRSAALLTATTGATLKEGTAMTMTALIDRWAYIVAPERGYVPPQYWSDSPPSASAARLRDPHAAGPTTFNVTMAIEADGEGVWLRDCASPDTGRLLVIAGGTRLTVTGRLNTPAQDYYRVIGPSSRPGCIPVQWLCCPQ